jgi:hypothetical protein
MPNGRLQANVCIDVTRKNGRCAGTVHEAADYLHQRVQYMDPSRQASNYRKSRRPHNSPNGSVRL